MLILILVVGLWASSWLPIESSGTFVARNKTGPPAEVQAELKKDKFIEVRQNLAFGLRFKHFFNLFGHFLSIFKTFLALLELLFSILATRFDISETFWAPFSNLATFLAFFGFWVKVMALFSTFGSPFSIFRSGCVCITCSGSSG